MFQLTYPEQAFEIVPIKTSGDLGQRDRLGAFVREIQEAVLTGQVDIALHCLKDLPTTQIPELHLGAYLEREDARDALIYRSDLVGVEPVEALPAGAVIGTGSLRRSSQLAARRPDFAYKPLVGNVDTRLRKLMEGEYDAIVLAIAGLKRLGVLESWAESDYRELTVTPLAESEMVPCPGQAILVIETRSDDGQFQGLVDPYNHEPTWRSAQAERAFLRSFGGGCSVPVGAFASAGDELVLEGLVASPDGRTVLRGRRNGPIADAVAIGEALAQELGAQGAFDIVRGVVDAREAALGNSA